MSIILFEVPAYHLPILFFLSIALYYAFFAWLVPWWKRRKASKLLPSTLESLLLNAGGRIKQLEGKRYEYEYQDGLFLLMPIDEYTFSVTFPAFFSTSKDELEAVRNLTNRATQSYEGWSFFYHYNERKDEFVISLSTRFVLADNGNSDEAFRRTLRACFSLRHNFVSTYQKEEQEENDERAANTQRDRYLLFLREYDLQPRAVREGLSGRQLGELLRIVGDHDILSPERLTIFHDDILETLTEETDILHYDLAQPFVRNTTETSALIPKHVTLVLSYTPLHNKEEHHPAQLTIALERLSEEQDLIFFRASVSRPAYAPFGTMALTTDTNNDFMQSVLFAYDTGRLEAREAEFHYMWNDAQDKVREKKFGELTDAQRLLITVDEQPLGHNLYWARKCSLSSRYVEAIVLFENAYSLLEARFEQLNARERETFAEVLYHLSFCYNAIGNYAMAFFYIQGLQNATNFRYQQELVNTLVNMQDYRSLRCIDRFIHRLDQMEANEEDETDNETNRRHRSFLYRRRLQALMNADLLVDAEEFAKRLRSREDCREIAEKQLEEIARLRAVEAANQIAESLENDTLGESDEDDL